MTRLMRPADGSPLAHYGLPAFLLRYLEAGSVAAVMCTLESHSGQLNPTESWGSVTRFRQRSRQVHSIPKVCMYRL